MSIILIVVVVANIILDLMKWNGISAILIALAFFYLLHYSARQIMLRLKNK